MTIEDGRCIHEVPAFARCFECEAAMSLPPTMPVAEPAVIEDGKPVVWVVDCPRCLHTFSVKPDARKS